MELADLILNAVILALGALGGRASKFGRLDGLLARAAMLIKRRKERAEETELFAILKEEMDRPKE